MRLYVVNLHREAELPGVTALHERFGDALRVVCVEEMAVPEGVRTWRVSDMDKRLFNWTRRLFALAFRDGATELVKLDPDSLITGSIPAIPDDCDVAGDFRRAGAGWVWFGAWQWFSGEAMKRIMSDDGAPRRVVWQDIELAKAVKRCGLRAYNLGWVNGWALEGETATVLHRGRSSIKREAEGPITLT